MEQIPLEILVIFKVENLDLSCSLARSHAHIHTYTHTHVADLQWKVELNNG